MIDEHYRTKREMVYYSLKTDILKGVIKPGTRLLVSDTAKKYNVSIIPGQPFLCYSCGSE